MSRHAFFIQGVPVLAAWLLSACTLGPAGEPQTINLPDHYGLETLDLERQIEGIDAQRFSLGDMVLSSWWASFNSPVLNGWVEEALANNADLSSASANLQAAQRQVSAQARQARLPSVDLGGQAARQRDLGLPLPNMPNTSLYNTFVGQAQIRYDFDLFGSRRSQAQASAQRLQAQHQQFQAARQSVVANLINATVRIAAINQQIEIVMSLLKDEQAQLADVQQQLSLGASSRLALSDTQQRLHVLRAKLAPLHAELHSTRHAQAILMGRNPSEAPEAIPFEMLALPQELPLLVPSALLRHRPDIRAAEADLRAAAAEISVATGNMFPSISISASMGQAGYDWSTALSGAGAIWSLVGGVTQPIFHAGALRAERLAAIDRYEAAQFAYKQTVLGAFAEVADVLVQTQADAQALGEHEAALSAADDYHSMVKERVRLGALPRREQWMSAQQWRQRQLDAVAARAQRFSDSVRFYKAMGIPIQP
ncbi:efflux transporter outer membrane subunit [Paenalcaligenes niemegkensis]|uniref:efflux transporter outer membrane subunit n=1 Tax=Paenalcaligenes niemegkensis TaxID=2895469 RepID=UPI001EE8C7A1|nr:efflux transporter outer membrane subunit [Paenalcaligenes niemegkensis]MCQ9615364.1 efflux transporter outer membrane subunit [Paenalcaligenes niemegkensis]